MSIQESSACQAAELQDLRLRVDALERQAPAPVITQPFVDQAAISASKITGLIGAELEQGHCKYALSAYATTCPITLTEFRSICQIQAGESLIDAYVEFRWDYARRMLEQEQIHE